MYLLHCCMFLLTLNFIFSCRRPADVEFLSDEYRARRLEGLILNFYLSTGKYPESLHCEVDVGCKSSHEIRAVLFDHYSHWLLDVWGRPFHYIKTADGYVLFCLGKDGLIGGSGLDEDIVVGPHDWSDSRKISND